MGEDVPYSVETVLLAERIMSSDTKYYIRRENSNSMTRVMRKSPSPQTVYENSFVCARKLDDVIKRIPDNELGIIKSVRNVEKYILLNSSSFIKDMTQTAIKDFRAICRRNFRSNLFVMKVLGHKQTIDYLLFIVGGADSFAMK